MLEPAAQVFQRQLLELVVKTAHRLEIDLCSRHFPSVAGEIPKLNDFNEMAVKTCSSTCFKEKQKCFEASLS